MNFEKATFAAWRDAAPAAAMAALKQPILARAGDGSGAVAVNFAPVLRELMLEARYLDRMHFEIPPVALQVALQEDEYRRWIEALEGLLDKYYKARRRKAACAWCTPPRLLRDVGLHACHAHTPQPHRRRRR
jgi:dynein heavy chain